jgi:adenine-specific DNA-methyltransferase
MTHLFTNDLEKSYILKTPAEKRKRFAQFFTPYSIARFMAGWVVGGKRTVKTILDPAIGLGVFIRAIAQEATGDEFDIKGYDLDPEVLLNCRDALTGLLNDERLNLSCEDYLFNHWHSRYDAIICNPPYFKFHDYETKEDALDEFQRRLGMKLSGFTNIYALFLLKSISQLNKNGRCAYIIPSEFLNADYGKQVKEYLIKLRSLRFVIIFNFDKRVFDEGLTTSSIFLFASDEQKAGVEFLNVTSETELEEIADRLSSYPQVASPGKYVAFSNLNPSIKWRGYYQEGSREKYANLVRFSTYANVSRGIATGANEFFLFNQEKAEDWRIPATYLEPVISKATQVSGPFFTANDFDKLRASNKNVYLLHAKDATCQAVNDYLAFGEKTGVHQKYLTSHRKPWYRIENRPPAPVWVSVFSRGGLRFVINEVGVRNLTAFHCLYLKLAARQNLDLFFSYLVSDVSREIFSDNRREYGNGLEKFEPNDLNGSLMIDLAAIPETTETNLLDLYRQYRASCLIGYPDSTLLDQLNQIYRAIVEY